MANVAWKHAAGWIGLEASISTIAIHLPFDRMLLRLRLLPRPAVRLKRYARR